MRPRLLMQLQQISQTGRPTLLLDVFPSTAFMPFLTRGLVLYLRRWGSRNPADVAIVQNSLCEMLESTVNTNIAVSTKEGTSRQKVVASICQPLRTDVKLRRKTEIFIGPDSSCEAFCLADGSYEFIEHRENGIQVMRWALRHNKSRRMSSCSHFVDVGRFFTFSIMDPGTRRHAVIATMTRDWIEVSSCYSVVDSENSFLGKQHCFTQDQVLMVIEQMWMRNYENLYSSQVFG
ncbi:hypothetical protein PEBR_11893 [Penicillium brasilianum]|uniref:Uncharacterized protein n=1 Tax=Penicillium brasilianum TaxID=104259 RepID=A0A1S9RU99_PENBI|nr:hypothetical protein PEBR_11893 [Penicillium brasilianum]